jgi:hypothetical protein
MRIPRRRQAGKHGQRRPPSPARRKDRHGCSTLFTDSHGFGWLPQDDFVNHFAADVDPVRARVLHAVQQSLAGFTFSDVMGVPA